MNAGTHATRRKVVIVGAGSVGSTFAYALLGNGVADEVVLTDLDRDLAEGQVLDLAHGLPYMPPAQVRVGDTSDYGDAAVIVITAGASQKPGESRLALLQRNASVIGAIMDDIAESDSRAVVVVVTNPVDLLTQVALARSVFDRSRVIGSGTVLDSSRFRYLISRHCGVNVHNVHAYILGEHGDSELAAWSQTHIGGVAMDQYCRICELCDDRQAEKEKIVEAVRQSAYHIIDYKGATCFAVGLALVRIVATILRDEKSVLTVSTMLRGEYGLEDVCLSVPCLVGAGGVERIVAGRLTEQEQSLLEQSASVLKDRYAELAPAG